MLMLVLAGTQAALIKYNLTNRFFSTIIYLLLAYCVITILDKYFYSRIIENKEVHIPKLFYIVVKVLIYLVVAFTIAKEQFGIDVVPLLTTSAVLSFVLGLALQETLTNLFAGVAISLEKMYKVGDWISINNMDGKVIEISWRTTKIETRQKNYLTIPNSKISREVVLNYNLPSNVTGLWIFIDVAYDLPPNKVKEVILENLRKMKGLHKEPKPSVQLREFKDSGITYLARVWIDDWGKENDISDEIRTNLWYAFKRNNISFPYPVRDVYIHEVNNTQTHDIVDAHYSFLANLDIFRTQDETTLKEISKVLIKKHYGKNETLFLEGDVGESLFIITHGKIAIIKDNQKIAELGKEELFGEMSLLTGKERTATAKALKDTDCLILSKADFKNIILDNEEIIDKIAKVIAEREMETKKILYEAQQKAFDDQQVSQEIEVSKNYLSNIIRKFFNV
ncbi:MAG: mechanosensitive ion channel [Nitrospirae bacterium]|nr:mechanosensitive ion channel [Nitrospirota bacterium]